jgi:hypothetical protein
MSNELETDHILALLAVEAIRQTMRELAGPDSDQLGLGDFDRGRMVGMDLVFTRFNELLGDSVMAYLAGRT